MDAQLHHTLRSCLALEFLTIPGPQLSDFLIFKPLMMIKYYKNRLLSSQKSIRLSALN